MFDATRGWFFSIIFRYIIDYLLSSCKDRGCHAFTGSFQNGKCSVPDCGYVGSWKNECSILRRENIISIDPIFLVLTVVVVQRRVQYVCAGNINTQIRHIPLVPLRSIVVYHNSSAEWLIFSDLGKKNDEKRRKPKEKKKKTERGRFELPSPKAPHKSLT